MTGRIMLASILAGIVLNPVLADGYKIEWRAVSSGGGTISGGSYKVSCTIAQPAAGFIKNTSILHWAGFWGGDVPTPTVVAKVGQAKLMPDGTWVSVAGKIATSAVGDFANFFYIEESERFSGIRVAAPPAAISELARGSVVNVMGVLQTLPSGERQIAGPIVIVVSSATPLAPLGVPGKNIGGGTIGTPPNGQFGVTGGTGINNIGLLIRTWGRVTATGTGYAVIDDGSGPVTIDTTTLASQPALDSYITVTGISSLYESDGSRYKTVLPRKDADVAPR